MNYQVYAWKPDTKEFKPFGPVCLGESPAKGVRGWLLKQKICSAVSPSLRNSNYEGLAENIATIVKNSEQMAECGHEKYFIKANGICIKCRPSEVSSAVTSKRQPATRD